MKFKNLIITFAASLSVANGANLLLNNSGFDSSFPNYYDGTYSTGITTAGWTLTITGVTAADYGGIGNNQNRIPNFAYAGGTSAIWTTVPADRAVVAGGGIYTFGFEARRDNSGALAGIVFVDWFDSTGTLLSSSADFGDQVDATSVTSGDPFGVFTQSVTAPTGSTAAGIRWGGTGGAEKMVADSFSLEAIPEPSSAIIGLLGASLLLRRTRR